MGGKRKKRKKRNKKRRKKGEVNKTKGKKGKEGGEEDRMKNRKENERKKSWDQVFNKRKYCVGTEPSAYYIGILVTSTTTGHDGSVVSIPSYGTIFFSTSIFYLPFPTSAHLINAPLKYGTGDWSDYQRRPWN